ncbi:MAG: TonB-dependent receptor [Candidatus Kapaibacteriota bacterium]
MNLSYLRFALRSTFLAHKHVAHKYVFLVTIISVFACSNLLWASGEIKGKITDKLSGDPLAGVSIVVKGTNNGAVSNTKGEYYIRNVAVGEATLTASYLGFEKAELTLTVKVGELTIKNFTMKPMAVLTDEVVVSANLEGQQKALNQQRTADNIKNIVSADLISRFPDLNIGEALQRVPGVQIERNRGEGNRVQLRGTPFAFTTVNMNGEQLVSTEEQGSRGASLDLIPVDLLASMEITKALTPDQDGDAIGGSVNLRTPMAKSLKPKIKAELGGGYNNLIGGFTGIGKFGWNQRFFEDNEVEDGRLGVRTDFTFYSANIGEDRIEVTDWGFRRFAPSVIADPKFQPHRSGDSVFVMNDYRYRDQTTQRRRVGAGITLDYKFNNTSNLIFDVQYSNINDEDVRRVLRFRPNSGTFVTPEFSRLGRMQIQTSNRIIQRDNLNISLTGESRTGAWLIDYGAFVTVNRAERIFPRINFNARDIDMEIQGLYTDLPKAVATVRDIYNPLTYNDFQSYADDNIRNAGRNVVARINATLNYQIGDYYGVFKTGIKARSLNNARNRMNIDYNFVGAPDENEFFARFRDNYEDIRFYNRQLRIGPTVDHIRMREYFEANRNNRDRFLADSNGMRRISDPYFWDANETVLSGYAMTRLLVDKWMFLGGVRVEHTQLANAANQVRATGDRWLSTSRRDEAANYTFVLPSVHVKYSPTELLNLRGALTFSYARPDFNQYVPIEDINPEGLTVTRGNPNVRPSGAMNADLLAEYFLPNVGIVSGGFFYKRIDRFIYTKIDFVPAEQFGIDGLASDRVRFTTYDNGEVASVLGAEVNVQANLDFLPFPFNGLGVYANYTFTQSAAFTQTRQNISFPGQSPHSGNFALSYDIGGFAVKGSLNYNGRFILNIGPDGQRDEYAEERWQLDVNTSYRFDKYRVYAEFLNLLNQPRLEFFGLRSRISNVEFYGWSMRFGVSYTM